jgi:hypothetical protein
MKISARQTAICGLLLAASVILLCFASFVPNVESTAMAVAGALVYVVAARFTRRVGAVFFVASVLLSLLLVPSKLALLPYIFSFGPYGLLKPAIESLGLRGGQATRREEDEWAREADSNEAEGKAEKFASGAARTFARISAIYLLKIAVFGAMTGAGVLLFKEAFFSAMTLPNFAVPLLAIGALALFLLYDRILSLIDAVIGRRIVG